MLILWELLKDSFKWGLLSEDILSTVARISLFQSRPEDAMDLWVVKKVTQKPQRIDIVRESG